MDKSNECNDEQPENILFISITDDVSRLDKFSEINDEQPENIPFISITDDVSKLDKSISVILIHPLNIKEVVDGSSYQINLIIFLEQLK